MQEVVTVRNRLVKLVVRVLTVMMLASSLVPTLEVVPVRADVPALPVVVQCVTMPVHLRVRISLIVTVAVTRAIAPLVAVLIVTMRAQILATMRHLVVAQVLVKDSVLVL
jgi:hypothetical protein